MHKKTIKVKTLISQNEKSSNPIFKAIYKKIRNLAKKISSIEALEKQNRDNLKPQQILKIQKKGQIGQQIAKCQQFAIFYKELLQDKEVENNVITDELIKIATGLAVSQAIQYDGGCKDKTVQQVSTKFFQPITAQHNPNTPVGERIVETVELLTQFLQNDKYYKSCRNYVGDFAKSSAIQSSKQSEKASSYQKKKKVKKEFEQQEDKIQEKETSGKKGERQNHASQEKQKKQKSLQAKKSHSQEKQPQKTPQQVKKQSAQEKPIQQAKQTQKEEREPVQQKNNEQQKKYHYEKKTQNRSYQQNRDYNNQYRSNNRNQPYGKQNNWNRDKKYEEKSNRYKPRQTVRQGSDTSLQPTPQKIKKPKYIQKS